MLTSVSFVSVNHGGDEWAEGGIYNYDSISLCMRYFFGSNIKKAFGCNQMPAMITVFEVLSCGMDQGQHRFLVL